MKKIKLTTIALVLFAGAAFTSCSNDDDNKVSVTTKKQFVTLVAGPTTGTVNQELTLNVTYAVDNACGSFNKFVETAPVANTKQIEVEAKYTGSNCGTTPATKVEPYKFKATAAGTYALKFKKSATEFVTQTIVIN